MQDRHGLLTAPISQVLRNMTIPMIFGMVAILMFNLIDTFFIALLGTDALAAISFTFPVTFLVNCITMGLGVGISTNIARLLGQKKSKNAATFTFNGLLLTVLIVSCFSFLGLLTIEPLFRFLGAEPDLISLIKQYMTIWYLTVPLLVIPMAGNSAIRATGDTKTPAKIMILCGLINGGLDPLLIFGYGPFPELGIMGAAIASAVSWFAALIGSLWLLLKRERLLALPKINRTTVDAGWLANMLKDWKGILKIGMPASLSNAMTPLSGAVLMSILASHGITAVAAYGAAQRIESMLLIVLMSLTSILTPFMAQNIGAKNRERSFQALFISIRFSIVFQLIVFIMLVPISSPLAAMFAREQEVNDLIWLYLVTVPLSYGGQGVVMMLIASLNSMHKPLLAFGWSFIRLFVFTLPAAWLGSELFGVQGLFAGIALSNILGGALGYLHAVKLYKTANIIATENSA